jgi:3-dehydroquinate dehydratase II
VSVVERDFIAVLHGVNLDQLGQRDPQHYGQLTLPELEEQIARWGDELGFDVGCFPTNHEGEFVEKLHALRGDAVGLILNPGAWTHYAHAIHDALELTGLPAVEVHLSDVNAREPWRRVSVIQPLCIATVSGQGPEGYREALQLLGKELEG